MRQCAVRALADIMRCGGRRKGGGKRTKLARWRWGRNTHENPKTRDRAGSNCAHRRGGDSWWSLDYRESLIVPSASSCCANQRAGGIGGGFTAGEIPLKACKAQHTAHVQALAVPRQAAELNSTSGHGWDAPSFSNCVSLGPVPVMKTVAGWSPVKAKWGVLAGSV